MFSRFFITVKFLAELAKAGNFNERYDHGQTLLHGVAYKADVSVAQRLLELGAEVDARNIYGMLMFL